MEITGTMVREEEKVEKMKYKKGRKREEEKGIEWEREGKIEKVEREEVR